MKMGLKTWLIGTALSLSLGVVSVESVTALPGPAGVTAQLTLEGLSELKAQWGESMAQRRVLERGMRALGSDYEKVVARISVLKRNGVDNLERRELETLLRKGRALARELEGLQQQINTLDARISRDASQIVARLDAERARLELQLVSATVNEQVTLVGTLNEVAAERARYAQPLPRLERKDLALLLEDADGLDDPGDMLAMADELQDAESEVRTKLGALQEQLSELKRRQRLMRRAQSFSREERFFEEGDRGRAVVARISAPKTNGGEAPATPTESAQNNQPSAPPVDSAENEAPQAGSPPQANANNSASGDNDGFDSDFSNAPPHGEPTAGADDQGALEGARDSNDPGIQDSPGTLGQPEVVQRPSSGDPFATPQDTIVVDRQADPNISTGNVQLGEGRLDVKIKRLEKDRKELEQQAVELKARAKRLRERAERAD